MDYTYKIIPYAYWQVKEYEQWLMNQAKDGWEAISIGYIWARFKRIQPNERTYKIIFNKAITLNQDEAQEEWKKIRTSTNFYIYMSIGKSRLENLGYNQEEEQEEIEKLKSGSKAQSIMFGICFSFSVIILSAYMIETDFVYKLITGDLNSFLNIVFMQLILFIQNLTEYMGLNKLQKQMEAKIFYKERIECRKSIKGNIIRIIYAFSITSIFLVTLGLLLTGEYNSRTLPREDIHLSIIRLASLEEDATFKRYESEIFADAKVDLRNCYERKWNLLIGTQYEAIETGEIKNSNIEVDTPILEQKIYKLRFKALGDLLVRALIEKYDYRRDNPNWEVIVGEQDTVYISKNNNRSWLELIVQKDDYVVYVSYIGNASTDKVIEQARKMIK